MPAHKTLIIGHRGARGLAKENTLDAFEVGIQNGVDMIETDVQMTRDGVLVLLHKFDGRLSRKIERMDAPENQAIVVHELTFKEIRELQPDIPTLEEAINLINRRVPMIIEVKANPPTKEVVETVKKYLAKGWKSSDFMFNSIFYAPLKEFMEALPEVERIIQGNWSGIRVQYLARKLKTKYILLDQRYLWWGYVYLASKRFNVLTYTYPWFKNEPFFNHFAAERWMKWGLWGLITDYPDHFKK